MEASVTNQKAQTNKSYTAEGTLVNTGTSKRKAKVILDKSAGNNTDTALS